MGIPADSDYTTIEGMKELGMDFIEEPEFTYERAGSIDCDTVFSLLNTTNTTMSLVSVTNMYKFVGMNVVGLDFY